MMSKLKQIEQLPGKIIGTKYLGLSCGRTTMSYSIRVDATKPYRLVFWQVYGIRYNQVTEHQEGENGVLYELESDWASRFNQKREEHKKELEEAEASWMDDESFSGMLEQIPDLKHYYLHLSPNNYLNILSIAYQIQEVDQPDSIDEFDEKIGQLNL